jgi:hypothetical protein
MLIDEVPGKPLLSLHFSEQVKRKIFGEFGDILENLSKYPLDRIGSLAFDDTGAIHVGPVASDRTGTLRRIGPFSDATLYYSDWAEEYLKLIASHQLFTTYPVNAYLIFKYIHKLAMEGKFNPLEPGLNQGPFYLKHMDDKGDHIFVDDNFNITGIIDWSFARSVPAYEAFGPSLFTSDLGHILDGKAGTTMDDILLAQELRNKKSSLARFSESSGGVRRLTFALGMGMNLTWDEALLIFRGIITEFEGSSETFDWETWRAKQLGCLANDTRLALLIDQSAIMSSTLSG